MVIADRRDVEEADAKGGRAVSEGAVKDDEPKGSISTIQRCRPSRSAAHWTPSLRLKCLSQPKEQRIRLALGIPRARRRAWDCNSASLRRRPCSSMAAEDFRNWTMARSSSTEAGSRTRFNWPSQRAPVLKKLLWVRIEKIKREQVWN